MGNNIFHIHLTDLQRFDAYALVNMLLEVLVKAMHTRHDLQFACGILMYFKMLSILNSYRF